jgi:hypothetical protein
MVDPPFLDLVQRYGVEEVEPFAAPPHGCDKVRGLEDIEVLRRRLPSHLEVLAELAQRLTVVLAEAVEQVAPGRIGERLEDVVQRVGHAFRIGR